MSKMLFGGNPDVKVDFVYDSMFGDVHQFALSNEPDKLVFYMADLYKDCAELKNLFHWYCQVEKYLKIPAQSETRSKTNGEFRSQANDHFRTKIVPKFRELFDKCVIVSGQLVIDNISLKGKDRYREAVNRHLKEVYTYASYITSSHTPTTGEALKNAILRPIDANEYTELNPLSSAEKAVKTHIDRQAGVDVVLSDITSVFQKRPYGWNEYSTIYVVNELVRRHARDYSYSNNPNVETNLVASRLIQETNKFTLRQAKAISQELINKFTAAWKNIFGVTEAFSTNDSTQIFRLAREKDYPNSLFNKREGYRKIESEIGSYAFAEPIHKAIDIFDAWITERNPETFFQAVIDKQQEARELIDKCKEVVQFTHDQIANYKQLRQFAKDNEYNFPFVPIDDQDKVAEFVKIENDPWPIEGFRNYLKLMRDLKYSLDQVREGLREKIRIAYNEQFDYLEKVATEQNVPLSILPNRENVIMAKTAPDNILVLQNNINTDAFYQEQIGKILDYVNKRKQNEKKDDNQDGKQGDEKKDEEKTPNIRQVTLQTKTRIPLSTQEDIDHYLAGLREQLLKLMVDSDGVMIIK
jgi:hypothetical protein